MAYNPFGLLYPPSQPSGTAAPTLFNPSFDASTYDWISGSAEHPGAPTGFKVEDPNRPYFVWPSGNVSWKRPPGYTGPGFSQQEALTLGSTIKLGGKAPDWIKSVSDVISAHYGANKTTNPTTPITTAPKTNNTTTTAPGTTTPTVTTPKFVTPYARPFGFGAFGEKDVF